MLIVAHVVNDNSQDMVSAALELRQRESVIVAFVRRDACPAAKIGPVEPDAHTESGAALGLEKDCAFGAGGDEVTSCGCVSLDSAQGFQGLLDSTSRLWRWTNSSRLLLSCQAPQGDTTMKGHLL